MKKDGSVLFSKDLKLQSINDFATIHVSTIWKMKQ